MLRALLFLAIFAVAGTMPMQSDSYWHLRTGLELWQRHAVPRHDPFAFTVPPDYPWPNHEWLAQALFYAAYRLGGLPLLTLLCAGLATLALLPSHAHGRGRELHRAAILIISLPLVRYGWAVRPQLFTLLFLAVSLHLLVRERFLFLPPLFVLWANLHGGVTLGGLLMLSAVCVAFAERLRRPQDPVAGRRLRLLFVCTGACGLATLLSPLGPRILLFPLESVHRLKAAGIIEWRAPDPRRIEGALFWLLALGFLAALLRGGRRLHGWEDRLLVGAAVPFLLMAGLSVRNIPPFLLFAVPALTRLLPERFLGLHRPERAPGRTAGVAAVSAAALLCAAFLVRAYTLPLTRLDWRPMSAAAIAAVRNCPRPMYNTYDNGGYLLWFVPERKVFIDSRQDPYPLDFLLQAIHAQRTGDHEVLFRRYGIRSAAVGPADPVGLRLLRRGWHKVYADARWLILSAP